MTIAFVQKAISADANGSVASVSVTISAGGTGNLICGTVTYSNAATLTNVKDNNGVTYTLVDTINDNTNGQESTTFYLQNISGAPTSIIASFSPNGSFTRIEVQEWSGINTAAPLDGHNAGTSTGTTVTSPTFTTTVNGDLLYGGCIVDTSPGITISAGSGYSIQNNGGGGGATNCFADESQIQSAASASTVATFGLSASDGTIVSGMAFKAASGSTGSTIPKPPILVPRRGKGPQRGLLQLRAFPVQAPLDQNPIYDLPLPLPRSPADTQTWTWNQTRMLGQDRLPSRPLDWTTPRPPPWIEQTWIWRQVDKLGKDKLPFRQQDWPNPVPSPNIDRTWTSAFRPPVAVTLPFNQYDWPNPAAPPRIDETWTWRQTGMFGQDKLPFRQQDWPNPVGPPRPIIQNLVRNLSGFVTLPFNQYNWPNPVPPPKIDQTWTSAFRAPVTVTIPHHQFDWPNPSPIPNIDRTWLQGFNPNLPIFYPPFLWDYPNPSPLPWRDVRSQGLNPNLSGPQPSIPFRQFDWPNPIAPPNIDHSWLQPFNVPLQTFVSPSLPHNQYDWPNPAPLPRATIQNHYRVLSVTTPTPPATGLPQSNPFSAMHNFGRLGSV